MIPSPPPGDGPGELVGWAWALLVHIHRGVFGTCTMCHEGTWDWLDLSEARLPLVADDDGVSTDQSPLHARCVPALISYWRVLFGDVAGEPASPTEREPEPAPPEPAPAPMVSVGAYARRHRG